MKRSSAVSLGLSIAGAVLCVMQVHAQTLGYWSTNRNDAGRAGAQKAEKSITKESFHGEFKFLWKLKLGKEAGGFRSYSEPLLIPRLINSQGFKDFVIWSDRQNVYAVDSELGKILWQKHYDAAPSTCGASNLAMTMEPPLVINFGARRAPGQKPAPPQGPLAVNERRIGVAAGGGGFGLKGIYVLTPDGALHEQVITTGVDFASPVKFVPHAVGFSKGLALGGTVMYTTTSAACAGGKNALYMVNMASSDYPMASYDSKSVPLLAAIGPTLGDDVAYVVTGKSANPNAEGVHSNSLVALTPDAKVKAWYKAEGPLRNVSPVSFTYKGKRLVVAPGKSGSFVLLDGGTPGGEDHHTVLAETPSVGGALGEAPDALAVWQDTTSDTTWIFSSIHGAVNASAKFATSNGATAQGSIVAFKLEENNGKMALTPQWVSKGMVNPAPPVIANGLVLALAQGNASTPARLLVLDVADGKELYTSGTAVPTYALMAGVTVGDGHVFFVTHDNTLYSFGIGIEH